jgi:cysteinyl-tRNA synthetase
MKCYANKNTHLVMNITDIDDKIIKKASVIGTDWKKIAKTYEKSFFNSMSKLNVKLPDVIIRVSDVIPKIIVYIQKIIDNGFAYVTQDGSVYFDSQAYVKEGYCHEDLIDEEETQYQSELSPLVLMQKRNQKDFALWKGRTELEVGFNTEFVYESRTIKSFGRPGWHIECSAMIDETIGSNLDIHLGGIDLKFPHHYNERLQAHAYYHPKFKPSNNNTIQWATTFYHIGHLCVLIEDENKKLVQQKMAKSLKNFTSIDDALKSINSNQMRWMFVMRDWTVSMEYCNETIEHAKVYDTMINNFINTVINYPFDRNNVIYKEKEFKLAKYFTTMQNQIVSDLRQLRFVKVSENLRKLINRTNAYIGFGCPNQSLIEKIHLWIFNLIDSLGFIYDKNTNDLTPNVMNVLIETRTAIRMLSRDKSVSKEIKQKLFAILDEQRNSSLPGIGIVLQDTKDSSSWFRN